MTKKKRRAKRANAIVPIAEQTRFIDRVIECGDDECNLVMLEPRQFYDHAITDVVMDVQDGSQHVVYSYDLLVRWTSLQSVYSDSNYTSWYDVLCKYESDTESYDEQSHEWVDYNTLRGIQQMGPNRPFIQAKQYE
jgi:hypothetical protein